MESAGDVTATRLWTFGEPVDGRRRPQIAPAGVGWHDPLYLGGMDRYLAGVAPVSLSDDGTTAVVATAAALVVLDAATGAEHVRIPGALNAYASPGWDRLAVLFDGRLEVRNITSAEPAWSLDLPQEPLVVAWSPDGTRLAVLTPGKLLCVAADGHALSRWPRPFRGSAPLPTNHYCWVQWLPDGRRLAVLSGWRFGPSGGVVLVDTDDGSDLDVVEVTAEPDHCLTSLGVTPDGSLRAGRAYDYGSGNSTEGTRVRTGGHDHPGIGLCSTLWSGDGTRCFLQHGEYRRQLHEWLGGTGVTACTEAAEGMEFLWLLAASRDGRHVLAEIQRHHVGHFRRPDGELRPEPIVFGAPEHYVPGDRSSGLGDAWGLIDTTDGSVTAWVASGAMVQPPRFSADGRHVHWVYGGLTVATTDGDAVRLPGGEEPTLLDDDAFIAAWVAKRAGWLASLGGGSSDLEITTAPPPAVRLPRGAPADAADVAGGHVFVLDGDQATMYRLPD